jgi:AcrR family transcriptional regulator
MEKFSEKKQLIMREALKIFAEKGYDCASVRDVAAAADVNVAMISYYFGSKDKLLEEIFRSHTKEVKLKVEAIIQSTSHDALEKVDLLIDTILNIIISNIDFHRLMMREQVLLREGTLYDYIKDMKRQNRRLIELAVKSGQKAGIFQSNVDISMLATILIGSIQNFIGNYKYICEEKNLKYIAAGHFDTKLVDKFRSHLKIMFKSFLTYGISK